ncbi:MAG: hypothetical protein A3F67_04215 [Verrucomicrobia bacterium RIFCSPHIGHO2_12_FULL_41_10]|nr:MAG: hypothetical protein A3F67_04215 [Verrucomicrobia bacterium RIFCSPHIGHO2_12_FULL_41_10]HLB57755.1 hypothetical protein [Gammaproteobacteria bacterium]
MQMTKEQIKTIIKAQDDFYYFVKNIFSQSKSLFPKGFIDGGYIKEVCEFLQSNKKTARVSARDHFKSTAFYAHFMWRVLCGLGENIEAHFFSFQNAMACYHVEKIKNAINTNPYFDELKDKKASADSVISYTWDGENFITLKPHGLLEFKRGIHAPLIYVDDPFQDPANKMVATIIYKINDIFRTQVLDMVQNELHVCGTPQTNEDFFFDKDVMGEFAVKISPAIVDEKNKIVLWPEWKGWERLEQIRRERGEKIFLQEYLCTPSYSADAFIDKKRLFELVNDKLSNNSAMLRRETQNTVVAGFDIGKKTHPSHFAVFELLHGHFVQIHSKFMDGWDYVRQIDYINEAVKNLGIDVLFFDATRGEFDGFIEQGKLTDKAKGVVFSMKSKNSMAAQLDKHITNGTIEFINDQRQIEQMLTVTNDLDAIETPQGHGDSFWSIALALNFENEQKMPEIIIL